MENFSENDIRRLAYTRWEARGCPRSDDWADWFWSENRLRSEGSWLLFWLPLFTCGLALLLLLGASVTVFGLGGRSKLNDLQALAQLWLDSTPEVDPEQAKAVLALKDASARLAWMVFGLFQTLAFLGALAVFTNTLLVTDWCKQKTAFIFCIYFCTILLVIFLGIMDARGFALDQFTGSGLAYTGRLSKITQDKFGTYWLPIIVKLENGLAAAVIIFGALASGALIANPDRDKLHTADDLKDRIVKLRNLLTISAVVLVIGVMQISAEYRWPAAVIREKVTHLKSDEAKVSLPLADVVANYASAVTLTAGGAFSLFLIAVFGTSFFVIDRKAQLLADNRQGDDLKLTIETWREQKGLSLTIGMIYGDLGKILGPLFLAIVGSFVKF